MFAEAIRKMIPSFDIAAINRRLEINRSDMSEKMEIDNVGYWSKSNRNKRKAARRRKNKNRY